MHLDYDENDMENAIENAMQVPNDQEIEKNSHRKRGNSGRDNKNKKKKKKHSKHGSDSGQEEDVVIVEFLEHKYDRDPMLAW
jgi:hypothetical protein